MLPDHEVTRKPGSASGGLSGTQLHSNIEPWGRGKQDIQEKAAIPIQTPLKVRALQALDGRPRGRGRRAWKPRGAWAVSSRVRTEDRQKVLRLGAPAQRLIRDKARNMDHKSP